MKARNENLTSIDAIMDAEFGKPGTPEREEFRKEAYAYCMGQIICDARKKEKMTQSELARSRIRQGLAPRRRNRAVRAARQRGIPRQN